MKIFKNRTILGVICITLSLIICFLVTPLFNAAVSEKTEIIRVKQEIRAGEMITKNMIETVEVGGYNLPENIIKTEKTIIGTYALADMYKGDYILNTKISETKQEENAYLYNLDGTKQAMSVSIKSFATGLSGKLESGDIISIISPNHDEQGATIIPEELKYVEVVSVTANTGVDVDPNEEYLEGEERKLPSTVTLLVTPEQSKLLAELESDGEIHVSLVYRGSYENSKKFLDVQAKILEEKYFEQEQTEEKENMEKENTQ